MLFILMENRVNEKTLPYDDPIRTLNRRCFKSFLKEHGENQSRVNPSKYRIAMLCHMLFLNQKDMIPVFPETTL